MRFSRERIPIECAVIPAAGLGTRLRPLSAAIPKEMLPIGRKPVLEHVVDELRECGLADILFVVSPHKNLIQRYFGDGKEIGVRCSYVTQAEMKGLGDAVSLAEEWVGARHFVTAFGDCMIRSSDVKPLTRLLQTHTENHSDATVLGERIPIENSSKYGILNPDQFLPDPAVVPFRLKGVVEKPSPEVSPSRYAVAARWALSPEIFGQLRQTPKSPEGELHLTDAVQNMIQAGASAWGVPLLEGESRWDIGGWETYLVAAARAAAEDLEFGDRVRRALCSEVTTD